MTSPTPAPPATGDQFVVTLPDDSFAPRDLALWAGVLVLLTLIAYWPSTDGQFVWGDGRAMSDAMRIARPGGVSSLWFSRWSDPQHYPFPQYHPAAFTSQWIVYQLFGHDAQHRPMPFAFHVVNLLLHAGAAVLVWLILRRLKLPGAWLAAAVFALHPINAESVSWITQRDTVLAGVFFFGSIYAWFLFSEEDQKAMAGQAVDPARQWGFYAGALLLFLLAMLSKSIAFAGPVILLLILWWQRRVSMRQLGLLLPFVILAVWLGLSAADFERDFGDTGGLDLSWTQRFAVAGHALWFYAGKILLPMQLTFIYPRWDMSSIGVIGLLALLGVIVLLAGLWVLQKRLGRGPMVAVLAFILCLFPLLGIFNIYPMRYTFVADHYAYLASVPLIALVIAAATIAIRQVVSSKSKVITATGFASIILVALAATTWARTHVFTNSVSLWQDTVAKNPELWLAHSNLALALREQALADLASDNPDSVARADEELRYALDQARRAVALNPDDANAELVWGRLLLRKKQYQEALPHLVAAHRNDPNLTEASEELAETLIRLKQLDTAIQVLNSALAHPPQTAMEHHLLAAAYAGSGNDTRAMSEEELAIQLDPQNLLIRQSIANLLVKAGRDKEAIRELTMIAQLQNQAHQDRAETWNAIGKLEAKQGNMLVAITCFKQALALDPDFTEAKANLDLANISLEKQRKQDATRPTTAQASAATAPSR